MNASGSEKAIQIQELDNQLPKPQAGLEIIASDAPTETAAKGEGERGQEFDSDNAARRLVLAIGKLSDRLMEEVMKTLSTEDGGYIQSIGRSMGKMSPLIDHFVNQWNRKHDKLCKGEKHDGDSIRQVLKSLKTKFSDELRKALPLSELFGDVSDLAEIGRRLLKIQTELISFAAGNRTEATIAKDYLSGISRTLTRQLKEAGAVA